MVFQPVLCTEESFQAKMSHAAEARRTIQNAAFLWTGVRRWII